MPKHPGAINGGFFPKQPDRPAQYPSIVIAVDDIEEATDRVARAGGRVLGEPMEIPGVGRYVSFMDPEGNRVSMLEPSRRDQDSLDEGRGRREHKTDGQPVAARGSHLSPAGEKSDQQWSPRRTGE
jgi:hypothetical protein